MSNHLQLGVIFLTAASLVSATDQMALATPELSFGMSCVSCDGTPRDALRVNGDPEALPTFTVEAGETVQLSFDVYREEGVFEKFEYVLGVRGMDAPGLHPSLGSDWEYRNGEDFPYVLNDEHKKPHTFTLELAVDLSTPADLYYMEAIVSGHDVYEHKDESHWSWFGDSWDQMFPKHPDFSEWTFGSFGTASSELDSSSQTEAEWFDLQPFNLRVISSAVPEPSTFALLVALTVGLSPMRIRSSRGMLAPR